MNQQPPFSSVSFSLNSSSLPSECRLPHSSTHRSLVNIMSLKPTIRRLKNLSHQASLRYILQNFSPQSKCSFSKLSTNLQEKYLLERDILRTFILLGSIKSKQIRKNSLFGVAIFNLHQQTLDQLLHSWLKIYTKLHPNYPPLF